MSVIGGDKLRFMPASVVEADAPVLVSRRRSRIAALTWRLRGWKAEAYRRVLLRTPIQSGVNI
jgi:hypothetical protein